MASLPFASHHDLMAQRYADFQLSLAAGEIKLFILPQDLTPAFILLLTLLFVPRLGFGAGTSRSISCVAFAGILAWCGWVLRSCRSLGMANGYGIGLMMVWGSIWASVLLVWSDPVTRFKRVEWRWKRSGESKGGDGKGAALRESGQSEQDSKSERALERTVYSVTGKVRRRAAAGPEDPQAKEKNSKRELYWQSYPQDGFWHRLDWVTDLLTGYRGPGWDWHIASLPKAEYPNPTSPMASTSSTELLKEVAIRDFLRWYLIVDGIKTIVMHDPYFWGIISITTKPPTENPFLPDIFANHTPLLKIYRLFFSLTGVVCALNFIFSLSPLVFAVIYPALGLDRLTRAPLQDPLLYPPYWSAFGTSVLDGGIAGWWGKWWHQMFRMGMSEPSRFIIERFGLDPKSQPVRLFQLLTAFACSGTIHAGASYGTFSSATRPLARPFAFFMLQAAGIFVEGVVFQTLGLSQKTQNLPKPLKRAGTLAYCLIWAYFTGPLLVDDFAASGIWLFEPVPVSIWRGLGLGPKGERRWCWHGVWAIWSRDIVGTPWYRRGVAVL